jgi:hypothetical protein
VAHHWGVYLDESLGFGDDFEGGYASHWGTASVHGVLGGFDGSTLRCKTPAGAEPPDCTAEPDGRVHYVVGRFSPLSGSAFDLSYAPLELYLMGLVSADEIPQTYTILTDAAPEPLEVDPTTGDMTIDASGVTEVSVDDIIAEEGPRALYADDERTFTVAVVLLTATKASDEMLEAASPWAESFGGHAADAPWPSFEDPVPPADGPCRGNTRASGSSARATAGAGSVRVDDNTSRSTAACISATPDEPPSLRAGGERRGADDEDWTAPVIRRC